MKAEINVVIRSKNYLRNFNFSNSTIVESAKDELKKRGFKGNFEIEVIFAGIKRIKSINKKYRKIDCATDVLSFPFEKNVTREFDGILGSIVICPEIAKRNIIKEDKTLQSEIMFLIAHSVDHLVGIHH